MFGIVVSRLRTTTPNIGDRRSSPKEKNSQTEPTSVRRTASEKGKDSQAEPTSVIV